MEMRVWRAATARERVTFTAPSRSRIAKPRREPESGYHAGPVPFPATIPAQFVAGRSVFLAGPESGRDPVPRPESGGTASGFVVVGPSAGCQNTTSSPAGLSQPPAGRSRPSGRPSSRGRWVDAGPAGPKAALRRPADPPSPTERGVGWRMAPPATVPDWLAADRPWLSEQPGMT